MSVYRHAASPFWHYDFQLKGRRFHGSTGRTAKGEALAVERTKKEEARRDVGRVLAVAAGAPMTFDEAAGRWWNEVGQFLANATDAFRDVAWLIEAVGPFTILPDITTRKVADIVARRRASRYGRAKRLVSNATVNRTCTQLLRRILRRAEKTWEEKVRSIEWEEMMLPEPKERVREASVDEENRLMAAMRTDAVPLLAFLIVSGCRRTEAVTLTWDRVDWGARAITMVGKGDRTRIVPITSQIRGLLWPLRGHHPTAVFTYEAQRPMPARKIARGDRVPMTVNGFKKLWRNVRETGGVPDFRLHDSRHTTGTRLLRETGNLRLVQILLGHANLSTTAKYAHVLVDDVRAGMEAVAAARTPRKRKAG